MSSISDSIRNSGKKAALIPFITAGFPFAESTVPLLQALAAAGADVIELGVPFSDPMADGPAIQRANQKALENRMSLVKVLQQVKEFRAGGYSTPLVLMGYANSFVNYKGDFAAAAREAGVNGVIMVDLADSSRADWQTRLDAAGIDMISLIAPTTAPERMRAIAAAARGFLYFISLRGVTGANKLQTANIAEQARAIRQAAKVPLAVGFGIRDAEQALEVAAIADAVVIGSRLIEIAEEQPDNAAAAVGEFVASLEQALR